MVVRRRKRLHDQLTVSQFFQNLISNAADSSSKPISLHINNAKVYCVPCKPCSKSPKPTQRTFIILCSHVRGKVNKSETVLPVIESATSYVGNQEQEESSFEVTSSRKRPSRIEQDDYILEKSDIAKTQHSQTGDANLTVKTRISRKQNPLTHNKCINSIGLDDLQLQFGKRREEAAKSLRVSVSTLKRIARKHGITSWPYSKTNRNKGAAHSLYSQTCLNTKRPIYKFLDSKDFTTHRLETTKSVKVNFGNEVMKFEIHTLSKFIDLEETLRNRLKLEIGSFTIKYMDEDQDLILITCDADLSYCIRSSGNIPIKMVVNPIIDLPS